MNRTDAHDEIRILIVDGHELFVEGLRTIIQKEPGMSVVAHAADAIRAMEAATLQPHVILLEMFLEKQNTLDLIPSLLNIAPGARVLIVTGKTDPNIQA